VSLLPACALAVLLAAALLRKGTGRHRAAARGAGVLVIRRTAG